MAQVPYPISGDTQEDLKRQVWELIRELYEDRIAGLNIGDVFRDMGDVLNLRLATNPGLEKTGSPSGLQNYHKSDGGLTKGSMGNYVKCKPSGHLDTDSEGLFTTMSITKGGRSGLDLTIKDTANFYCSGGSIEINEMVYDAEEQLTINLVGALANTTYYLYVRAPDTGSILTASEFTAETDAPTWVDAKGGYYLPTSGNYRYIGACEIDDTPKINAVWQPRKLEIKYSTDNEPTDKSMIVYDSTNNYWTNTVELKDLKLSSFFCGTYDLWGGNVAINNVGTTIVLGNLDGTPKIALGAGADALTIGGSAAGFIADGTGKVYFGDGSNQYFKFNGSNISWKGTNTELTAEGELTVSNIKATGGTIGGWTLTATTLTGTKIVIDSGNDKIIVDGITIDGANNRIRSSNYVSGVFGAGFTLEPDLLEVGNIAARGIIRTAVFQKDVVSAVGGNLAVLPADLLNVTMIADDNQTF